MEQLKEVMGNMMEVMMTMVTEFQETRNSNAVEGSDVVQENATKLGNIEKKVEEMSKTFKKIESQTTQTITEAKDDPATQNAKTARSKRRACETETESEIEMEKDKMDCNDESDEPDKGHSFKGKWHSQSSRYNDRSAKIMFH